MTGSPDCYDREMTSNGRLAVAAGGGGGGDGGGPLVMTPQLREAIRMLQKSRLELLEEIRKEVGENPVLEEE